MTKSYGEIFHDLRLAKHMTLVEVAANITTESYLSKFERGISVPSLSLFLPLLTRLTTSLEEFFVTADMPNETLFYRPIRVIQQLQTNRTTANKLLLLKIYKHARSESNTSNLQQHVAIIAEAALTDKSKNELLSKASMLQIVAYFEQLAVWTNYELTVFNNIVIHLPATKQLELGSKLLAYVATTKMSPSNSSLIIDALLAIIKKQLSEQNFQTANKLLLRLNAAKTLQASWETNMKIAFYSSIIGMKLVDTQLGYQKALNVIAAIRTATNDESAEVYLKFLATFNVEF